MFEIGQYIVKANTGVCRIVDITTYSAADDDRLYYNLIPESDKRSKLFVPVESDKSNMRSIMTGQEALELIKRIPDIATAWIASDRQREQEYKEAIKSNSPEALVSIIKNLYMRTKKREAQGKKSTAIDDRYFRMAETALYSELAVALDRGMEEIRRLISETIEG